MFTRSIKVLFVALCGIALAACSKPAGVIPLTAADAGRTVRVSEGDLIEVALEGNPTTGYTWQAAPDSGELFAQQGEPEFKADSSALGSGGTMTLQFKAVKKGTAPLKLIYHRSFEPKVAPLRTFSVTVVIQ